MKFLHYLVGSYENINYKATYSSVIMKKNDKSPSICCINNLPEDSYIKAIANSNPIAKWTTPREC